MSFGRIGKADNRRSRIRRQVRLAASAMTIASSQSVLIEDLSPSGARLLGRRLPPPGKEILLRTSEFTLLARIAWARSEYCGVTFEDSETPSPAACLALQLRTGIQG